MHTRIALVFFLFFFVISEARRIDDPLVAKNVVVLVRQAFEQKSPGWHQLLLGTEPFSGSELAQAQLICKFFNMVSVQGPLLQARNDEHPCRAFVRAVEMTAREINLSAMPYPMVLNQTSTSLFQSCRTSTRALSLEEYKILAAAHTLCQLGLPQVYQ